MATSSPFLVAADLFDPVLPPFYNDPVAWAINCIDWQGSELGDYQAANMDALIEHKRIAIRGPHGLGKTTTDALLVLWFALTRDAARRDWKIPTTADAWRQLEQYLWPEIHKWAKRVRWDVVGRDPFNRFELLDLHLKLNWGEAFALASNDSARLEGAHADSLFYLIDEAKLVPPDTWDAIEGAFSNAAVGGNEAYALANSTPGPTNGRFYDIHRRLAGYEDWHTIHVTLDQAIRAGRISLDWADQRKRQWGATSAMYLNRVLGEFAPDETTGVIPLQWVEAANERWIQLDREDRLEEGFLLCVGADIARGGGDKTILAVRHKPAAVGDEKASPISRLIRVDYNDTMATANLIDPLIQLAGVYGVIDVIGLGAGVVDRLRELGRSVVAFNAAERTEMRDSSGELQFTNKRSAAWWHMRDLLSPDSPDPVALPPDDELTGDLCAPRYRRVPGGRIQVEGKDDIRKRIGRSTDAGDAVIQAYWPEVPSVLHSGGWGDGSKMITGDLLEKGF